MSLGNINFGGLDAGGTAPSGGFLSDLGSLSTDFGNIATGIEPLLVGSGVISPVSTISSGGIRTVTTSPGATSVPGTFLGFSTSTIFLVAGAVLVLVFVLWLTLKK